MINSYFFGIDVGTQGVRVILVSHTGEIVGSEERKTALTEDFRMEQSPDSWWNSVLECLQVIMHSLPKEFDLHNIKAISVTSTSGTVIPLDIQNRPLHPALMYSDNRQEEEGKLCRETAISHNPEGYTAFNSSSGLSKILWYIRTYPEKILEIHTWVHATDYIIGKLSGNFRTTDFTNALKSGYDITHNRWPSYIYEILPIHKSWLQEVVPSGTPIGYLSIELSKLLGLSSIQIVAGMTDGCASQVASGAVNPGDWNTTIGTTLVIKGVTKTEIKDPEGRLYCHRHPEGYWMPGGASNTGADWISKDFGQYDLGQLNQIAETLIPTRCLVYPLIQEGERFPFISKIARGFAEVGLSEPSILFAAGMEGVGYIEKLSFELIERLSGERPEKVYTAGGGSNSDTWLKIRASILNCPIHRMSNTSGALGAAILAASQITYKCLGDAAKAMTTIDNTTYPDPALVSVYESEYQRFRNELGKKEYLK